jgi:hypothetical protein
MNLADQYTLRELSLIVQNSTPNKIRFALMFANNHSERLAQVHAAINWISQEHSKTRQHRYERDEDALTVDIITELKALGFTASHDADYGGHSDIVIEERDDFLWLGEAKIHSSYDWLLKGFQQLDTRYATAMPGQDAGGMIIYCKGKRADQVMDRWSEILLEKRPDVTFAPSENNQLVRNSSHTHERTGRQFNVRHVAISLYFDPQDKQLA